MKEKVLLILKRVAFYILSFTWGFIMSFIGLLAIIPLACMKKVRVYHGRLCAAIGHRWGGVSLGCFFIASVEDIETEHIKAHESGHGIQNIMFGPFFIFLVSIPSAIRYWYRHIKYTKKGIEPPTAYDDIWFEGMATKLGYNVVAKDVL